ncbi:ribonuclease 3-like [Punica granatum]|uniref:Uncharacterized protein n=2 Tax=Punica granatum TaxID=22663 RepID=A0A218WTK4_PUNGR|nr:ribonuclease 3-like [Punica granatum]OWM75936.1 hypothetical protein CDL15_Pgr009581 [Punica granatum]PKI36820.1 hypothetical protein CRG98_042769 [Punica granatum]
MKYASIGSILIALLSIHCLSALCAVDDFDFFYFVQQWPGSYCDSRHSCCYPKTGKPAADFGIHGLWPNYKDGSYQSKCNPDHVFDKSEISDLISSLEKSWPTLSCPSNDGLKFWEHEWEKHGTCSESELDQHDYFEAGLKLKEKTNLLQALKNAGIEPNDKFYRLESIKEAIKQAVGHEPGIECNVDPSGHKQLSEVYLCVDTSGMEIIECPILPKGSRCASNIQFPKF